MSVIFSTTDWIGRGARLPKWQKIIFTLAENGSQKICICQKKAVPL